jgi:hypothetical protein
MDIIYIDEMTETDWKKFREVVSGVSGDPDVVFIKTCRGDRDGRCVCPNEDTPSGDVVLN